MEPKHKQLAKDRNNILAMSDEASISLAKNSICLCFISSFSVSGIPLSEEVQVSTAKCDTKLQRSPPPSSLSECAKTMKCVDAYEQKAKNCIWNPHFAGIFEGINDILGAESPFQLVGR